MSGERNRAATKYESTQHGPDAVADRLTIGKWPRPESRLKGRIRIKNKARDQRPWGSV